MSEPDLKIAQYHALRAEIIHAFEEYGRVERFAFGGSAAVYTWIFSQDQQALEPLIFFVPTVLLAISMVKGAIIVLNALRIGRFIRDTYTKEFESPFDHRENHLSVERAGWRDRFMQIGWLWPLFAWNAAILFSLYLALSEI